MRNLFFISITAMGILLSCNSGNRKPDTGDIQKNSNTAETPDNRAKGPKGTPAFKETIHDFGKIIDGEIVQHKFTFTNTGKGEMTIAKVQAACGCTTPEWTKDVIPPGGTGEVLATFNSNGKGDVDGPRVEKSITVSFGNSTIEEMELRFVSNIYKKEEK